MTIHIFFFIFSLKIDLDISAKQTVLMKCEDLFSTKIRKKKHQLKVLSAAIVVGLMSVQPFETLSDTYQ